MARDGEGTLSPGASTELLRRMIGPNLTVSSTRYAKDQMELRGLIMDDVFHVLVLRHGFVHDEGEPSTRQCFFKYRMESTTPNPGGRTVRIVVVPTPPSEIKLVTVMWKDE